ncbi:MAG TPA: ATP-binding cassette domain-containing protein [Pyrinomonadaceae bacterium]|nr:ATP-binding cassette domain-containing protein [Pyrinomonadaceae bacterium]
MALTLNKVSKRLGDKWVLRDIDLSINDGEIVGIFGASGSGKSTLLKIIAGEEKPSSGEVQMNDTVHLAARRTRSGIGAIFGSGGSMSEGETAAALLDEALASNARVLLVDRLFTLLDQVQREYYVERFREAAKTGKTVIIASADLKVTALLCDRIVVLAGSYIAQVGFVQEVYENPATRAVAEIAGRNNLFVARRLTSTNAELPEFQTIYGEHHLTARSTEKAALGALNKNVTLAVRPEHISISFEAAFPEDNIIKAVVTGIRFTGHTTIVSLDAGGLHLESRVFRVVGLNVGEQCMIAIPPHRIQVLKD